MPRMMRSWRAVLPVVVLGLAAVPASAGAFATVTAVESDRGSIAPLVRAGCAVLRPDVPPPSPVDYPGCPGYPSEPPPLLAVSRQTPVTIRFSEPPREARLELLDAGNAPLPGVTWTPVDARTFRVTLPRAFDGLVYATARNLHEDTYFRYEIMGLFALRHVPRPTTLLLHSLTPRLGSNARLTLGTSQGGTLRLSWEAAGRKGSRTLTLPSGRHQLRFPIPRSATRARIRATLQPTIATPVFAEPATASRTFTLAAR